jgi:hypothetical protein
MDTFHCLVFRIPTSKSAMQYRVTAANDQADGVVQWSILRTETMSVVCEGNMTIVDSTAWMPDGNTINHNHINHVGYLPVGSIMVKAYALVAVVPYLGLTVKPETEITCLYCRCESILLRSSMRDLKRLLTYMQVFKQGEDHEAVPDVISLQLEPEWPVRWWDIVLRECVIVDSCTIRGRCPDKYQHSEM